jgi:hypothetical protein
MRFFSSSCGACITVGKQECFKCGVFRCEGLIVECGVFRCEGLIVECEVFRCEGLIVECGVFRCEGLIVEGGVFRCEGHIVDTSAYTSSGLVAVLSQKMKVHMALLASQRTRSESTSKLPSSHLQRKELSGDVSNPCISIEGTVFPMIMTFVSRDP